MSKPIKHTPPRMNPNITVDFRFVLAQATITKYHRLDGLNNIYFSVLEARKSEIKVQADLVLTEVLTWYLLTIHLFLPGSGEGT